MGFVKFSNIHHFEMQNNKNFSCIIEVSLYIPGQPKKTLLYTSGELHCTETNGYTITKFICGATLEMFEKMKEEMKQFIIEQISKQKENKKLITGVKEKYEYKCQICGNRIMKVNRTYHSRFRFVKEYNVFEDKNNIEQNIILLCGNHDIEFFYGTIGIDPETMKIIHIDQNDPFHGKELQYQSLLSKEYIRYHFEHIFGK